MNDEASSSTPKPDSPFPAEGMVPDEAAAGFDYEIVRLIGRGAYGEVYLARDANRALCAVKVIFRESFDHDRPFEREYEAISKFEVISRSYHDQVQISYIGRREEPRQFYYVMELADDQDSGQIIDSETYVPKTLRSELKRRGRLSALECVSIGIALARGLESLHENGLIHRDIKPANILFVHDRAKLGDIGMVARADMSVAHAGTEGFIPPEGPGSVQADIFGLGKVLYEMSTGLDRMDFPELPSDLEELPDRELLFELDTITAKACARDPRRRYQTARELCNDLFHVQQGGSVRRKKFRQHRLAVATKACVALVALGIVGFAASRVWRTLANKTGAPAAPSEALEKSDGVVPGGEIRNLIVNGSFETPVVSLTSSHLIDSADMAPWQTTESQLEVWPDGFRCGANPAHTVPTYSADGRQNLEILAHPGRLGRTTVWQTVPTVARARYAFSFYHTPRPAIISTLTVSINSTIVATFKEDGTHLSGFDWQKFATNFVAVSNLTTLSFSDRANGGAGTHIDGVVLTAVGKGRDASAR